MVDALSGLAAVLAFAVVPGKNRSSAERCGPLVRHFDVVAQPNNRWHRDVDPGGRKPPIGFGKDVYFVAQREDDRPPPGDNTDRLVGCVQHESP